MTQNLFGYIVTKNTGVLPPRSGKPDHKALAPRSGNPDQMVPTTDLLGLFNGYNRVSVEKQNTKMCIDI